MDTWATEPSLKLLPSAGAVRELDEKRGRVVHAYGKGERETSMKRETHTRTNAHGERATHTNETPERGLKHPDAEVLSIFLSLISVALLALVEGLPSVSSLMVSLQIMSVQYEGEASAECTRVTEYHALKKEKHVDLPSNALWCEKVRTKCL